MAPLTTVLSSGPQTRDFRTRIHYPPVILCDLITDGFWVISTVIRLVCIWSESTVIKAE